MRDFLDVAHKLWQLGEFREYDEDFKRVFNGIASLQLVHSKSQLDITNIESVFAAFEMGKLLNKFPNHNRREIVRLNNSIRILISKTIEKTIKFLIFQKVIMPPKPYKDFVDLIVFLNKKARPQHTVSVITFNYDLSCDYAFAHRGIRPNYSLRKESNTDEIPLLKLHGSLNWAFCPQKKTIVSWNLEEYFKNHSALINNKKYVNLPISSQLGEFKYEGNFVKPEPIIVPPTWNKTSQQLQLSNVWARAAEELGESENIIIIGYSLPESDYFFKYLFSLGSVGNTVLERFWVFDPDNSGGVKKRFQNLLGTGAIARFSYFEKSFEQSILLLTKEFS